MLPEAGFDVAEIGRQRGRVRLGICVGGLRVRWVLWVRWVGGGGGFGAEQLGERWVREVSVPGSQLESHC